MFDMDDEKPKPPLALTLLIVLIGLTSGAFILERFMTDMVIPEGYEGMETTFAIVHWGLFGIGLVIFGSCLYWFYKHFLS